MTALVSNEAYANIRGAYGYLGVEPLTTQQEMMLLTHLRGLSVAASARAAGMAPSTAQKLLKEDRVQVIKDFFRQQMYDQACIDLNTLNQMALEAHRKSANATEELKAIDTLGRLNEVGAFASAQAQKDRAELTRERDVTPRSTKELEQLSQDKLMDLADFDDLDDLAPQPVTRESATEAAEGVLVDE